MTTRLSVAMKFSIKVALVLALGILAGIGGTLAKRGFDANWGEPSLALIVQDNSTLLASYGSEDTPMLISSETCPFCAGAKKYLQERGIGYQLVESPGDARVEGLLKEVGTTRVPVLVLSTGHLIGFERKAWDQLGLKATQSK